MKSRNFALSLRKGAISIPQSSRGSNRRMNGGAKKDANTLRRIRETRRTPSPPAWPRGELRDPWPDGPRDGVQNAFQEACLDTGTFPALVRARPDAALEVLLAVCIEPPKDEDFGRSSMPETGLDHWHGGDPPLYCRGPFLQFLKEAPDQGLSFALRLVNFASRRFCEGHGLTVRIGNEARLWYGNLNVFRWHHDWPVTFGSMIHNVLMAAERWLYEKIERGEDIDPWINRILRESESLAFAGLLFDVGKYRPTLFAGVLKAPSPELAFSRLGSPNRDNAPIRYVRCARLLGLSASCHDCAWPRLVSNAPSETDVALHRRWHHRNAGR